MRVRCVTARSITSSRTSGNSALGVVSRIRMRAFGRVCRSVMNNSGSNRLAPTGDKPSASSPLPSSTVLRASSAALRNSASATRARARKALPAAVSDTPRPLRFISCTPSSSSSCCKARDSAGCDIPSCRAAPRMLPTSTTLMNCSILCRRTQHPSSIGNAPYIAVVPAKAGIQTESPQRR